MKDFVPVNSFEKHLCERATVYNIPINAILELTPLCNMNCDMCYVRLSPAELEEQGRLLTVDEWILLAENMKKRGTLFVLLTGGEPLLYLEFRELYLKLKELGMIITINTNGTLIDEEWADFFEKYPPRRINITLYGKDEHTYNQLCHYQDGFRKTITAIQLLKERNIDVKINGSLTPLNVQDADELISLFKRWDVAWKIDTYMYPATRERIGKFQDESRLSPKEAAKYRVKFLKEKLGKDKFILLAKQLIGTVADYRIDENEDNLEACRAGRSSFSINWQGKMRPCVLLSNPEVNLLEIDFDHAWDILVEKVGKIKFNSNCNKCEYKKACNTCVACAFLEGGTFEAIPEYMCSYTKETLSYLKQEIEELQ